MKTNRQSSTDDRQSTRIMVVEDEALTAYDIKEYLEEMGYSVTSVVASGEDAVERAEQDRPDLILMDIFLQGPMNGIEAADRIHSQWGIPVIFLTAYADNDIIESAKVTEPFGYLTKPFVDKELGINIEMALCKAKVERQLRESNKRLEQAADELRVAKEQAESANQAKTRFLANLTHDIRTHLGAIMGFNQLLLEKCKDQDLPADADSLEYHENIQISAQMLMEMINNFLDISKIEAGKIEMSEEDFSIQEMVRNISDIHEMVARKKGVILACNISPELPAFMRSDRTKLIQILTNLIGNAIKFTPEGREVRLRVMGDQEIVAFMVIDQGIGIPKDRQQAIFGEFEQADDSTSRKYGGTGLGLAITKKLTEMLGGKISVASQGVDQGSNFNVRIPFKEASSPVADQKDVSPGSSPVPFKEASSPVADQEDVSPGSSPVADQEDVSPGEEEFSKESIILMVEDNLMNQVLIGGLLEKFGLKVLFADDGKQGVDKTLELVAKGSPPDLIFMDIQMPVMDGFEATRQIRQRQGCQEIPIVGLSADAFMQQEALDAGMSKYLTKPVDIMKLRGVLNEFLSF